MRTNKGFTLVELMIVVAVVAILVAIAYPSYTNYVVKTNRETAKGDLLAAAGSLEQARAQVFTYLIDDTDADTLYNNWPTANPSWSPSDRVVASAVYNLAITQNSVVTDASNYELTAQPIGTGMNQGDGTLVYMSAGSRCWFKTTDTASNTNCSAANCTDPTTCETW